MIYQLLKAKISLIKKEIKSLLFKKSYIMEKSIEQGIVQVIVIYLLFHLPMVKLT
jgi:hypothetical protein